MKEPYPVGEKGPEETFTKHKVYVGLAPHTAPGKDKKTSFILLPHPSHIFSCQKERPPSLLTGDACLAFPFNLRFHGSRVQRHLQP